MGRRTLDIIPATVELADGSVFYEQRVVRDDGTVYAVARRRHYPTAEPTSHSQVVLCWSGEVTLENTGTRGVWRMRDGDGNLVGTITKNRGGCGCGEPIKKWSP